MNKTIGVKVTPDIKNMVNRLTKDGLNNSEVLRRALLFYDNAVNHPVNSVNSSIDAVKKIEILQDGVNPGKIKYNALKEEMSQVNPVNPEIDDDTYSQVYNEIYSMEICPLIIERDLLKERIGELRDDKKYLMGQNNALMLAKTPLLARIKMRLLRSND